MKIHCKEALNIIALRWPRLATALDDIAPCEWTSSRYGEALRLTDDQGRAVTLFSPRDPWGEAREALQRQVHALRPGPVILFGVGAGHRLASLVDSRPDVPRIAAVIVHRGAFLSGLAHGVVTAKHLSDPRLELFLGDREGLAALAPLLESSDGALVMSPSDMRIAEDFAREAVRLAQVLETHGRGATRAQLLIRENFRANLKHLCTDTPVRLLGGLVRNLPVVIAGAGPSLEDAVDALKNFRDRYFLVAVEAALAPLHHMGLRPDIAVSVDPFESNERQCRELPFRPPLVYMPSVHPGVPGAWDAPRIAALPAGDPLAEAMNEKLNIGLLKTGGIVGTAATALADFMGGNPLILVGMDLAFTKGRSHAFREERSREALSSPYNAAVPAIGGGVVETNPTFQRAVAWFELFAATQQPGRLLDACSCGAAKIGFAHAALEEIFHSRTPIAPVTVPIRPLYADRNHTRDLFREWDRRFGGDGSK